MAVRPGDLQHALGVFKCGAPPCSSQIDLMRQSIHLECLEKLLGIFEPPASAILTALWCVNLFMNPLVPKSQLFIVPKETTGSKKIFYKARDVLEKRTECRTNDSHP